MRVVGAFIDDQAGAVGGDCTWILVFLSCTLNLVTFGSPRELFCARAHRRGWAMCRHIDALFRVIRRDDHEHCRACYLGQKRTTRLRARATARPAAPLAGPGALAAACPQA